MSESLPFRGWIIFHCRDGPFCLSIHLWMDTRVAFMFYLLWIFCYEHGWTNISLRLCFQIFCFKNSPHQTQKPTQRSHLQEMSRTGQHTETESFLVAMGLGGRNGEWLPVGTGFPFQVMEGFQNCIEGLVAQHCKQTKYHSSVHFKWLNLCKFHLN